MALGDGIKPANAITPDVFNRMVADAGVVVADYGLPSQRYIGVTRGGNGFSINTDYRQMKNDGAPGDVQGDKRIINSEALLDLSLVEMSTQAFIDMLPASAFSSDSTHDIIQRNSQIKNGDYLTNVALIVDKTDCSGEYLICILHRALAQSNFELSTADDDESVVAVQFKAHFDANDLSTEPWEIRNPLETLVTSYTLTYNAGANGSIFGTAVQTVNSGNDGQSVVAVADTGFHFVQWDDASTDNPRQDTNVTADVTVEAQFAAN